MRSDSIVGYTYDADTYCPGCILTQLPTGPGQTFDGWADRSVPPMTPEDNLAELAAAFGIDRMDQRTFDSGDFPKVIFADQARGPNDVDEDANIYEDTCGHCGESLIG